ncbi:MAG TPA: glycosyltransferase family 39 protein, partial [Blastocatellia bacterium]|nr:glycosyltransferase family 39 protein [Blastocatellia bacterium]
SDRNGNRIDWRVLLRVLLILFLASLALRIVYARFLFEDDGLWLTAAQQILRGKALYREIYFDKPPVLPLLYAGLLYMFGSHLLTIRIFTVLYSLAVSAVLYLLAFRLYGRREAIISASAFTVFSTCFVTGHAQGLNTDFLMTLPYALGAYLFIECVHSGNGKAGKKDVAYAVFAGMCTGVAFQTNPKGVFDLFFFLILSILVGFGSMDVDRSARKRRVFCLLLLACCGFAIACVPFLAYIRATGSFSAYANDVWKWGTVYARYYPLSTGLKDGLRISAGYFAVNNLLALALVLVVIETTRLFRMSRTAKSAQAGSARFEPRSEQNRVLRANMSLLLWLGVSYAGLAIGGRFFSHYFFEILPALSAIAGPGLVLLIDWLKGALADPRARPRGALVVALVIIGFGGTLARFHFRTAVLVADSARGRESGYTKTWYYWKRNDEEQKIAVAVSKSGTTGGNQSIGNHAAPIQAPIASGSPASNSMSADPSDYLFVWGYRPELYFLSGLVPASRFLSTQPLTGVPADVQYENLNRRSILSDAEVSSARQQLLSDLSVTRPKFIVDEVGMYNSALAIDVFPELKGFLSDYKRVGPTGLFMVYCRRDLAGGRERDHLGKKVDVK